MAAVPVPPTLPRADLKWTPTLADNLILPTCTIAGLTNSARVWALLHGFDLVNVEADLLGFYATLAGCAPTRAAIARTDGLVLLDVLEQAQRIGFNVGGQAPLVPDFAAIHLPDLTGIRDAIVTKGSAYVGVTLYESDMGLNAGWSGAPGGGVVGGHCITLPAYTPDGFSAATWGEIIPCDNAWLSSRLDEAYALSWTFPVGV